MRLIHTADWHLGRNLKGKDRTPEIEYALDELLKQAKALEVDAVLVAGDIFETPNPSVEAERVAYQFFCNLQAAKIPAVAIAGNHDSAFRLDNVANLLSIAGVHVLGKPRIAEDGGVITLDTPSGKLRVGAMPFANERRLLDPDELWNKGDKEQRDTYREIVSYLLSDLTSAFKDDSVNILMAHLTIDGAKLANSEKPHHSQGGYALFGQSLPPEAQYIALGHIHKSQRIPVAAPTYYSGSLIQVDFGEAGEEKGFYLIELEPGCPAKNPEFIPIPCQKPLKEVECDVRELEETLEEYRDYPGYLKAIIHLPTPQMGLADRIRKICDQVICIESHYPKVESTLQESRNWEQLDPVAEFRRYYQERLGTTPSPTVLSKFEEIYKEIQDASA